MTIEATARLSGGRSDDVVHRAVARVIASRSAAGILIDVGCGQGALWDHLRHRFTRYIGVDAVRYDGFPRDALLVRADLDHGLPIRDGSGDAVTSTETIEHLENPRALMRELARVARPGAWIIVSTPNQLSALSLLTLILKRRFSAFQDVHYPAHRTALLDVDLRRIAAECGLVEIGTEYSLVGRLPLSARHFPAVISRMSPRLFSDTILLVARKDRAV